MKLLIALAFVLGTTAMAEVKPLGTFVASQCSTSSRVWSVCFGTKEGVNGSYLAVSHKGEQPLVLLIAQRTAMNAGINPAFRAEMLSLEGDNGVRLEARVDYNGESEAVTLTLPSGRTISVNNFQYVMHTM